MPLFGPVSAGGIPKATVTATTGSPTIDTSSRPGKTIYKFTGSGSITIGTAGTCEVLVVGGGGAGVEATSNDNSKGASAGGGGASGAGGASGGGGISGGGGTSGVGGGTSGGGGGASAPKATPVP